MEPFFLLQALVQLVMKFLVILGELKPTPKYSMWERRYSKKDFEKVPCICFLVSGFFR